VVEATDGLHSSRLLVDCGLGIRQLELRLAQAGLACCDLDAIFVTHEHADHIGSAVTLARKLSIPLWMSHGTHVAIGSPDLAGLLRVASDGQTFAVGCLEIRPFTVPHDAREPLQLSCGDGLRRLGILTDLGHVSSHVTSHLRGCHALLLECNHDRDLLERSSYPAFLKARVGGRLGHLCNEDAAGLARSLLHDGLGHVVAAHLSEQNNRPELARAALAQALNRDLLDVVAASASGGSPWFAV